MIGHRPRVLFARHGESTANLSRTFANRDDDRWPLTTAGIEQARELARSLTTEPPGRIFSSPLLRARETAQVLASEFGTPWAVVETLREFDVGRWEGTKSEDGWAEYARATEAWRCGDRDARVGGGESLHDIVERFRPFVATLIDSVADAGAMLCISHGGLYRAALPEFLEGVTREFATAEPFGHTAVVEAELRGNRLVCLSWCGRVPS